MSLRTTTHLNSNLGHDLNNPRKVEAKMIQGPVTRRAFVDVGNRAIPVQGPKPPLKPGEISRNESVKLQKPKAGLSGLLARSGKENVKPLKEVVEHVEQMDVEEEAKVEELAIAFSTQRLDVEDIDAQDSDNPQLVSEYVNDIYKYLRELEDANKVKPRYLEGQVITGKMRAILIDWLVQVHLRFTLLQETLYLTVAIIDRFLQTQRNIPRNKLQLVGVTAMFIASKYEEMYCPEIGDFAYITDKAYSKAEIRKMEVTMLNELGFNVSYPLPLHFLRRNSKAGSVDASQHTLAKYLMELCLPEYSMCHYKSSMIAASALCLSLKLLDGNNWSDTLTFYSRYTEQQLMPVMCKMASVVVKSSSAKQQAVRQKYKASKLMKISEIPQLKSKLINSLAEKSASYA
ncbi:G2/mitotic-specific cyclin-B-like [Penaeus monodon]|uniref:Cyclin B n=1 Tax=Penaeus monodon TaxID=6687 RepID=C0J1S4_PENMO|nr:G2/mitotic-specific cyclin-B-like [Penaeus monodon]ACH72068.1 cyclin B [Penaeus monodon]ACH72069.1 cyclin B [Penaeus monodon]ACH72070.1 cyclin B [Penaeus monodon]